MKKLILILFLIIIVPRGTIAQVSTNKIVNTATIYATNSPFIANGTITGTSNVFIGGVLSAGTNSTLGIPVGTHFLSVSNPGNPVLVLRNYDPTGNAQFFSKSSSGADAAAIGTGNNGTNVIIHAFLTASSYIRLTTFTGSTGNEILIHPTVTTNTHAFFSGSLNSTNYMVNGVRGMTLSVTNVGIGMTNVEVFAEGLLTNKFTIP